MATVIDEKTSITVGLIASIAVVVAFSTTAHVKGNTNEKAIVSMQQDIKDDKRTVLDKIQQIQDSQAATRADVAAIRAELQTRFRRK